MSVLRYLMPLDGVPRAMAAKDRIRRVGKVRLGVISRFRNNAIRVVARLIAGELKGDPSLATRVFGELQGVVAELRRGNLACEPGLVAHLLGRAEASGHPREVRHRTADLVRGQLELKRVPRLQQHAFSELTGGHERLSHCAVSRLPEVAALGVLKVRAASNEGYANVGHGRTGENANELSFLRVRENEALPVAVKIILGVLGAKRHAAATRRWVEAEMNLGVVTQGLEVANAHDWP